MTSDKMAISDKIGVFSEVGTMLRRRISGFFCALILSIAVMLAACAPRLQPPGPAPGPPAILAPAPDHIAWGDEATAPPDFPDAPDALFRTADGRRLPLNIWGPFGAEDKPRAVILALHGLNDYANAFAMAAPAWAALDIATVAVDQRGFGRGELRGLWAGWKVMAHDARDLARVLHAHHPEVPLFLLGVSMGGAVVMAALGLEYPPPVDGAVLVAPAVWGRDDMPFYQSALLWLVAHSTPWARFSGRGLNIKPSDNIPMLRRLGRDPHMIRHTRADVLWGLVNLMDAAQAAAPTLTVPLLILYGERDQLIPKAPTRRMIAQLPDLALPPEVPPGATRLEAPAVLNGTQSGRQRVALYPSGWHMLLRDLQAAVVWSDVAAWILAPEGPLPSRADRRGNPIALLKD